MGRIRDESPAPIECRITFTWPSTITRAQFEALRHPDAKAEFIKQLNNQIHNDLSSIVDELIMEERYEVDVREIPR